MGRIQVTRAGWLAYGVALGVLGLDQLSKAWILYGLRLPMGWSVPVVDPIFHLTRVANPGMSFGLLNGSGAGGRWFLTVFAVAVAAALAWWARNSDRRLFAWAAGLLIGGSLGNVIDRLRLGTVVDFLDFGPLFPFVFNVADSGVTVGATLLLVEAFWPQLHAVLAPGRYRGN